MPIAWLDAMAKLLIHSGTVDDFVESYLGYAKRDWRLADRFEEQVKEAYRRVAADPHGGTVYDSLHRFYRLKNYPHLIIYRHSDADDTATIVAVAHPSRDQSYWQNR